MNRRWRIEWVWAGVATVVGCALTFTGGAFIRDTRNRSGCMANLKQIGLGTMQYIRDYDEVFPQHHNWAEVLSPYAKLTPEMFQCPSRTDLPQGYALHSRVSGRSLADFYDAEHTVLAFDADGGYPNLSGGPELLPREPRHKGEHGILFLDGRVIMQAPPDFKRGFDVAKLRAKQQEDRRQLQEDRKKSSLRQ
jgi:hypothetical protein